MTQEQILLEYHNLMISHIQAIEVSGIIPPNAYA